MLGRIRKFSTSIYSKVFLFIVAIPFVFWGMGDLFSGGNINTIVKIGKEKIHTQEFISYLRNKSLTTDQLNNSQVIQQMLYSFIGEMLILKEINYLDLRLSDDSLAKIIRSQKLFSKDGKFSRTEYEKFLLQNNFSAVLFEQKIIFEEKRKQFFNFISSGVVPSNFLINKIYNNENQKRNIEYFNLDNIIKKENMFSNKEIEDFYNSNKDDFSELYKSISYLELNPISLSDEVEYNDSFFKKIDEIEDMVDQGKSLDIILKKFNLNDPISLSINRLGKNKILKENNTLPNELLQKVFETNELEPTALIEIKNTYFIFEINDVEKVQKNLNDKSVKEAIVKKLQKKSKRQFIVNLIDKINKNEFNKDNFNKLANDNEIKSKKIKLKSRKDNNILKEGIVEQIYSYGEKRVIVVTDVALSEVYLVYINKIENVAIDKNGNDQEKYFLFAKNKIVERLYSTYDTYLKNKYKIDINYKALDGIKNYIR